jgi:hypothetical protein
MLEHTASEQDKAAGLDIADYLLKQQPQSKPTQVTKILEFTEQKPTESEATPTIQEPIQDKRLTCYVSDAGTLYIPTPPDGRITYTVYPSVETYNQRSELPTFVPMQSVDVSGMKQVFINLNTLTIGLKETIREEKKKYL